MLRRSGWSPPEPGATIARLPVPPLAGDLLARPMQQERGALRHAAWAGTRKLALSPLLVAQAVATRRRALKLPEAAGARQGRLEGATGTLVRVLIAGDSSAAGVGVARQEDALAGHLVRSLRAHLGGTVEWTLRARSGLTTRGVHGLLLAEPPPACDIAVVVSGVNDVVGQVRSGRALADRAALADGLLQAGLARHVVFAPLPPIHRFPLLPEPLRRVLGDDALRHDRDLAAWAAGRSDVSHVEIALELHAGVMATDGFHPGEAVYRICGEALGRHVANTAASLGIAR